MNDFINLITEESSYHISNIVIIAVFAIYGAYATVKKRIKLAVFKLHEKTKGKITEKQKEEISQKEKKSYAKEFIKAFSGLLLLYVIYILFRNGIIPSPTI